MSFKELSTKNKKKSDYFRDSGFVFFIQIGSIIDLNNRFKEELISRYRLTQELPNKIIFHPLMMSKCLLLLISSILFQAN